MRKPMQKTAVTLLFLWGAFFVQAAGERGFEIVQLRSSRIARYQLLAVKFRSRQEENKGVAIKIYALYRRGIERHLFVGNHALLPFAKGLQRVYGSISPAQVARYGRLEKWRAEIWRRGELLAEKNQPPLREQEQPWWKGRYPQAGRISFNLNRKMLEELDDDDDE